MTNKLVVIIKSLKEPKIKKMLLYEMKCAKLQPPPEPVTRGLPPPDPRSLCPQLNLLNPSEQNSWVRHWLGNSCSVCVNSHGTVCKHIALLEMFYQASGT